MAVGATPPKDYDEFFRDYWKYTIAVMRNNWRIPEQELEDMASKIMTRFVERDMLSLYDPEIAEKSGFKAFWIGFIKAYIIHYRQKIYERAGTEVHYDATADKDVLDSLIGGKEDSGYLEMDSLDEYAQFRAHLTTIRLKGSDLTYGDLLDTYLKAEQLGLKPSSTGFAEISGVSRETGRKRFKLLQEEALAWRS